MGNPTIAVRVVSGTSDEAAGGKAVGSLAGKQNLAAVVAAGKAELDDVAKTVISEFDRQLRAHGSFLKYSREVNVRVKSGGYQTIGQLLGEFENAEDAGEAAVRGHLMSLEMALV